MTWERLAGNPSVKRVLARSIETGAIHGAFIFAGPQGVGKYRFALEFAKALCCLDSSGEACDRCSACRRIESGDFLDVTTLRPDGKNIKVDQIRELIPQVYTTPAESRRRVFILDDADALNDASSNALLKTLEEPPPTSVLILVVTNPYRLLPTIRSRSQILWFSPLSMQETTELISSRLKQRGGEAELRARLSGGRPGRALSLDLKAYRSERDFVLKLLHSLTRSSSLAGVLVNAGEFGLAEREQFEARLSITQALIRDLLHLATECGQDLVNEDLREELASLSANTSIERLIEWYDAVSQLQRNLRVNINTRVAAEAAFTGLRASSDNAKSHTNGLSSPA